MRTTLGTADAGDDVRAAIHRLGPSFERDYITHTTISHWADIMGEMVARRVRAVAVKDKKLFLYAPDAVWKNEMRMSAPEIVQRVNNYAGGRMVTEIVFARTMRPIMETADDAAARREHAPHAAYRAPRGSVSARAEGAVQDRFPPAYGRH